MLTLELPFPPSVNHYYRHLGHCTLISKRGRQYRQAVMAVLSTLKLQPLAGPLSVVIELYPPDHRRRDIDNAQKGLLDSIAHGGAYRDDSQIVHLETWKCSPVRGGKAIVRIKELACG
jgi:crossover junction endodeoxyribonuclease RusA